MARSIFAVIGGYVVMSVIVMAVFEGAYLAMGTERAFLPGSYDVSPLWIGVSIAVGLAAAVAGGSVCAAIAKTGKPPRILAAMVLVFGIALAVPVALAKETDEPRIGEVSNVEAMKKAKQPVWIAFLNPFVGAAGVLIGAGLLRKKG